MNDEQLIAALRAAIGVERVLDDASTRSYYAHDLFWYGNAPACVVRPADAAQVQAIAKIAAQAGRPLVPRGGGMSYTGGYVADDASAVLLDLAGMNRVLKIDEANRYVTVEAGCTWAQLHEALAAKGLRTPYWGPLSGQRASVGGTASQNSVFFGSVRHGSAAETVLAIDVVLADGQLLQTGGSGRKDGVPFVRWGGPDITGLFIGDAGAFGIKVGVTLRLITPAQAVGFGSFGFGDFATMLQAQAELVRAGLGAETFGIDAYKARNSAQTGRKLGEASKTALGVIKSGKSLLSGLKDVAGMAMAGTNALENAAYSLHLTVEGDSEADTERQLKRVEAIVEKCRGWVLPPVVPKAMRGRPFPPLRSALGVDGQRWVPVHGILPLGSAAACVAEVEAMITARQTELEQMGVLYSPLTTNVPNGILFEPCYYWYDEVTQLHVDATEVGEAPAEWKQRANRPDLRAYVMGLWQDTARILAKHGAVNFQIGRAYPYLDTVSAPYAALIKSVKQALDPQARVNPGALGLPRSV
jgi:FAD/FMN-containing dehydrogenase